MSRIAHSPLRGVAAAGAAYGPSARGARDDVASVFDASAIRASALRESAFGAAAVRASAPDAAADGASAIDAAADGAAADGASAVGASLVDLSPIQSPGDTTHAPALDVYAAPLGVLGTQADLQYLSSPVSVIFNPPSATGMGFWSINPYVGCAFGCAYCYARDTHRWQLERAGADGTRVAESMPAWLAFERRILVKQNAAAKVREALRSTRSPKPGDKLVIGTATDPYQPAERHQCITRGVLEALGDVRALSITIITKSPLVTRDVDMLARLCVRNRITVHMSLITLDRDLARRIEPRAPTPESRLRAVRRLTDAGIDVGVNCMPVLPGITDGPQALAELVKRVAESGASHLATASLRLKPSAKRRYLMLMRESFPELTQRYLAAYREGQHIKTSYKTGLSEYMHKLCNKHGLSTRAYKYDEEELLSESSRAAEDALRTSSAGDAQLHFQF